MRSASRVRTLWLPALAHCEPPRSGFDPLAVRFCAVGALFRAAGELLGTAGFAQVVEAENFVLAANNLGDDGVPRINDVLGQAAVIELFARM